MKTTPSIEERIWAIISHLSSLAFGMGIVLPIIGWSDQRRKSSYASFQSLQALGYQTLGFTVWILSSLVVIVVACIIFLARLGPENRSSDIMNQRLVPWIVISVVLLVGFFVLYFILPILGVIACAFGRDFRYPILGDRLARYLAYDPPQEPDKWLGEEHEFRWVAAMGHFSILILLWGMLAPLTTWILLGKRNFFLQFQSVQTLVYQMITSMLYFVAIFLYCFGFLLLVVGMGGIGELDLSSFASIVGMIASAISLLISFLLILFVPLLHILGQWAGYRVLKGENYRYPWVGPLVGKWISKHPIIEEN